MTRRGRKPIENPTPRLLRQRADRAVYKAVRDGTLPRLEGLACVDCGAPATCYDHRDYRLPLDVQPVCKGCNNRRGPGLPLPDVAEYRHPLREFGKKSSGQRWAAVQGGAKGSAGPDSAGPGVVDDADDWRPVNEHGINILVGAAIGRRTPISIGAWRADYFKSHDPWRVETDVLPRDPVWVP